MCTRGHSHVSAASTLTVEGCCPHWWVMLQRRRCGSHLARALLLRRTRPGASLPLLLPSVKPLPRHRPGGLRRLCPLSYPRPRTPGGGGGGPLVAGSSASSTAFRAVLLLCGDGWLLHGGGSDLQHRTTSVCSGDFISFSPPPLPLVERVLLAIRVSFCHPAHYRVLIIAEF